MSALFEEIQSGRRSVSTLSGQEFQDLVFERLLHFLSAEAPIERVENQGRGAVDYVVYEPPGLFAKQRKHYFECKNYGRTLELDNVAKVMVVAVVEQPDSVNVVSRTSLQPQIRDYAAQLFQIDGPPERQATPMFRAVTFRHWKTDQLVSFQLPALNEQVATDLVVEVDAEMRALWWMTQCAAFSETMVASSDSDSPVLHLARGCRYLLNVEASGKQIDGIKLIDLPPDCWRDASARGKPQSERSRRTLVIDTTNLRSGEIYAGWLQLSHGSNDLAYPLPRIHVMDGELHILPELREADVADAIHRLGPSGVHRLILVDGEAGVGKTHFIERVATELRGGFGFDVTCFTISHGSRETLMRDLLLNCLTPALGRMSFQEVAEAVTQRLAAEDSHGFSPEAYLSHLVRLIAQTGQRILVLRDCHTLTESLANQLWALIQALDDVGWGGFRLVLEYRQPDGQENLIFASLLRRIHQKIRRVLMDIHLEPLTRAAMSVLVSNLFGSVTPEIHECLFRRTGGLPLFIESYLDRLHTLGLVEFGSGRQHVGAILSPNKILADTIPSGGALVLEDRIQSWLAGCFRSEANNIAVELGVLAVADGALRQMWSRDAMHLPAPWLLAMRRAFHQADLGYVYEEGEIVFRHDLLRIAVITVAAQLPAFVGVALGTAENIPPTNMDAILLRADLFMVVGDQAAVERELRRGAEFAYNSNDYGAQAIFLSRLTALLSERQSSVDERLLPLSALAWAEWMSGSVLMARTRYVELAGLAQQAAEGASFSIAEATATDAYRRIAGLDLDLLESLSFVGAVQTVLRRRPDSIALNSILNRLVLYCARFGHPEIGQDFAEVAFGLIGDGRVENQGAVLCSDLGMVYLRADPDAALTLFRQGVELAGDLRQQAHNRLDVLVTECLDCGFDLEPRKFEEVWSLAVQNRYSGISTRASLFRGALCIRNGDELSAHHWLERARAGVNLYDMRFLQPNLYNEILILALLKQDDAGAREHLKALVDGYEHLARQRDAALSLVPKLLPECRQAAARLVKSPSDISRPSASLRRGHWLADAWRNISGAAKLLEMADLVLRFKTPPPWVSDLQAEAGSSHRRVSIGGHEFILCAQ